MFSADAQQLATKSSSAFLSLLCASVVRNLSALILAYLATWRFNCSFSSPSASLPLTLLPNKKPPSSAGLDGGSLTKFVAQRGYPDLRLGFLLCFFCLLTNVFICLFSSSSASLRFNFPTKNPPVRAGSFALFMLSKPKIPDLDRAVLLGLLGERCSKHHTSFEITVGNLSQPT